jgi:hypothetical protein
MSQEKNEETLAKEFSGEALESAKRLAQKSGKPVDKFLASVREKALDPDFPSSNCLTPYEVSEFCETRTMLPERLNHRQSCVYCDAMLSALEPSQLSRDLLRERVVASERLSAIEDHPQQAKKKINTKWFFPVGALAFASILVFSFLPSAKKIQRKSSVSSPMTSNDPVNKGSLERASAPPESPDQTSKQVFERVQFKNQTRRENQFQIILPLENAKLLQAGYSAAAAATATASLAQSDGKHPSLVRTQLQKHYALALASWYNSNIGLSAESGDALATSPVDAKELNEISCKDLSESLPVKGLRISNSTKEGKSNICLVSYGSASMNINPKESAEKTHQYVNVLQTSDGDVKALDKAATDVAVHVVPSSLPSPEKKATK